MLVIFAIYFLPVPCLSCRSLVKAFHLNQAFKQVNWVPGIERVPAKQGQNHKSTSCLKRHQTMAGAPLFRVGTVDSTVVTEACCFPALGRGLDLQKSVWFVLGKARSPAPLKRGALGSEWPLVWAKSVIDHWTLGFQRSGLRVFPSWRFAGRVPQTKAFLANVKEQLLRVLAGNHRMASNQSLKASQKSNSCKAEPGWSSRKLQKQLANHLAGPQAEWNC